MSHRRRMNRAALVLGLLLPMTVTAQTICIDPGHPSEVGRGTRGKKLTEIEAAWRVGQGLARALRRDGYTVVLTKSKQEEFVRNRRRAEIANASGADLLVRLHCDAASGSGFAVYYPSRQGRAADGKVGPTAGVIASSKARATSFERAMTAALNGKLPSHGLKTDLQTAVGSRQGALTGSIYSKVPVLLIEMVVLTNQKDEAFLASSKGQAAMVAALAAGVKAAVPRTGTAGLQTGGPPK